MEKTKVLFVKSEDGEVTAIFPYELGTNEPETMSCYAHIGQHGSANCWWVKKQKKTNEKEYHDLFNELKNIFGYDLEIVSKFQDIRSYQYRKNELKRFNSNMKDFD